MDAAAMTSFATADLCDQYGEAVKVCQPIFKDFGGAMAFHGPIVTVSTFEDNSLFRDMLQEPGEGKVLVVDGGGSLRRALLGGNLAAAAHRNGWAGLLLNGCVRDSAEIAAVTIGVKALAAHPRRPNRAGQGELNVPVSFANVVFHAGEYLYADLDGVIVAEKPLV